MKVYVIDTNIILDNPENIFKLYDGENKIIIPETIIDEVDSKKSNLDELGFKAREFARFMDSLKIDNVINYPHMTVTYLYNDDIKIEIASKESYECEERYSNSPSIAADRRILEIVKDYKKIYENGEIIFVSLDTMCRLRAISDGISAETLGKSEEREYRFDKEINFDGLTENQSIESIDKDYKPQNYNYIINETSGKKILCQVINGRINILDESILDKQDIQPKNIGQKFFVASMINPFVDIIGVNANAGSGKTLLAVATAMRLVNEKKFKKIVYIRNSIESLSPGEDVGYLSGNEEKFAVYNHPLYDSLGFIAETQLNRSNNNKSKARQHDIDQVAIDERVKELEEKYHIETMWVGELRGRTISNAIVIFDECQNSSKSTGLLVLSRLDKSCKIIITGSNNQIDNAYINKYNNSLTTILNAGYSKHPELNLHCVNLDAMIRGPITEFAERVFKL